jgi:hypothetical protein
MWYCKQFQLFLILWEPALNENDFEIVYVLIKIARVLKICQGKLIEKLFRRAAHEQINSSRNLSTSLRSSRLFWGGVKGRKIKVERKKNRLLRRLRLKENLLELMKQGSYRTSSIIIKIF